MIVISLLAQKIQIGVAAGTGVGDEILREIVGVAAGDERKGKDRRSSRRFLRTANRDSNLVNTGLLAAPYLADQAFTVGGYVARRAAADREFLLIRSVSI
jgi:hypothetical protein